MEPVHVSKDDTFFVHDDDAVVMTCGKRLVKAKSLIGYVLAEYVDGTAQILLAPTASTSTLWMPLPSTTPIPRNLTAHIRELSPPRPSPRNDQSINQHSRA
jgi:hypothetical protein